MRIYRYLKNWRFGMEKMGDRGHERPIIDPLILPNFNKSRSKSLPFVRHSRITLFIILNLFFLSKIQA